MAPPAPTLRAWRSPPATAPHRVRNCRPAAHGDAVSPSRCRPNRLQTPRRAEAEAEAGVGVAVEREAEVAAAAHTAPEPGRVAAATVTAPVVAPAVAPVETVVGEAALVAVGEPTAAATAFATMQPRSVRPEWRPTPAGKWPWQILSEDRNERGDAPASMAGKPPRQTGPALSHRPRWLVRRVLRPRRLIAADAPLALTKTLLHHTGGHVKIIFL